VSAGADAPRVLLAATLPAPLHAELAARYRIVDAAGAPLAERIAALDVPTRGDVRAIVSIGSVSIGASVLEALPALGLVCCLGSGYEGVDLDAARARGVAVAHSPGANAAAVAEVAMGLLIASVRGFRAEAARLASGGWRGNAKARNAPRQGLRGMKLGIYGLGAIGLEIARRAQPFDMTIGYHNRRPRDDVAFRHFPSLAALAAWSDALMISVRASPATRHAVDGAILAALGADGHVVNIARGNVIDEAALVDALARGVIAGAGLDVYEHEPQVPAALAGDPRVFALPHIGGASREAQAAMQAMTLANLDAFFRGAPLPSPVRA
jgi:lactate dehydrogenase-like 2-hydroxyacid dehydrogenase